VGLTVEADILEIISDERALALFKTVALAKPNTEILITKTQLSRKQYYSRMSVLMRSGLVKRNKGRYALTAFGKVIYDVQITIEKVISNYYWKLKAIDSLESAADGELSKDDVPRYWTL
jgi:predicted transcriptional regulator